MLVRALEFSLLTTGITFAVAFVVAAIIKLIAVTVQREKKSTTDSGSK